MNKRQKLYILILVVLVIVFLLTKTGNNVEKRIKFFQAGVNGQHHQRQVAVGQADSDGAVGIHHAQRIFDYACREQWRFDHAAAAEDDDPGKGANQQIGPERDGDQKNIKIALVLRLQRDVVGDRETENQAYKGGAHG